MRQTLPALPEGVPFRGDPVQAGGEEDKDFLARCTFCAQCTDVYPPSCLRMSSEFLLADTDKYSQDLRVE
ncbi:MAG: hypothetical protein JXA00_04740 [Candidatus Thermoplasmatota archaeon]|nr:hypothetical protein [Candidatus Thermoplasmatota archaeon]